MANKIKYGLKKVYVAIQTEENGEYTYAAPHSIPGAVNLSLDAQETNNPFYADDVVYYRTRANNGYTGSLELALVDDWFRENILHEEKDKNGVMVESSNETEPVYFALLFEFSGDVNAVRHVMYNCSATRPQVASGTKEADITPITESLNLTCDPRSDGLVKCKTSDDTTSATYAGWYNAVYVPEIEDETTGG